MKRFAAALFLASAAAAAQASDGTIDINITSATAYTISAPGSYRVVDDVTMNAGLSAIIVNAPDVIIDLGGHTLTGSGGAASGGIVKGAAPQAGARTTIANGQIRGFSREGVLLADNATVRDMIIVNNGSWGADVGPNSVVRNSKFLGNSTAVTSGGVKLGLDSVIQECVVGGMTLAGNLTGILLDVGCTAASNSVSSITANGGANATGIACGDRATITGNTITGVNGTAVWGIDAANIASVRNNTVTSIAASTSNAKGIDVGDGSLVEANNCAENTAGFDASGIVAGTGSTIRGNNCYRNRSTNNGGADGIVTSTNCTVEGNTCSGQQEGPNVTGIAYGIRTGNSHVINNHCSNNTIQGVDGTGVGILCASNSYVKDNRCGNNTTNGIQAFSDCFLTGNYTTGNGSSGILLALTGNRCEMNRATEATGVANGGDDSLGVGDLANIAF